jgi:hypothetical protein
MDTIIIFVETKGDEIRKASLELLCEGARVAAGGKFTVEAVCLGAIPEGVKARLLTMAPKLVHLTDASLAAYNPEGYAYAVAGYAKEAGATIIMAGATGIGRDFLPRVAVMLDAGMISDATAANWDNDPMTFVRPQFGQIKRIGPGPWFMAPVYLNQFHVVYSILAVRIGVRRIYEVPGHGQQFLKQDPAVLGRYSRPCPHVACHRQCRFEDLSPAVQGNI